MALWLTYCSTDGGIGVRIPPYRRVDTAVSGQRYRGMSDKSSGSFGQMCLMFALKLRYDSDNSAVKQEYPPFLTAVFGSQLTTILTKWAIEYAARSSGKTL